jgi:Na+/melibiose symporter-like transporter
MIWKYLGVLFFASIKFLFSPFSALLIEGNTWYYTYFSICTGGIIGVTFFYFSAGYFMERHAQKMLKSTKVKKKFTKTNKAIIRIKQKVGIIGLAILTPLILSIPIGSIISAKFYRHEKSTIFILYAGVLVVGAILTSIAYLF